MEFFFLFILNIFTGAVIYLILSLKMERTTSTFHEQKLRKEMGEIITEFNATAERNITLLENRINVLKRLMGEQGTAKGIDFRVDDEVMPLKMPAVDGVKKSHTRITGENDTIKSKGATEKGKAIKTGPESDNILVGFIDKISNLSKDETMPLRGKNSDLLNQPVTGMPEMSSGIAGTVLKKSRAGSDISETGDGDSEKSGEEQDEIGFMFSTADDKYALIADLYKKGYSVDDIARHSGLPSGEVRLVISLNR